MLPLTDLLAASATPLSLALIFSWLLGKQVRWWILAFALCVAGTATHWLTLKILGWFIPSFFAGEIPLTTKEVWLSAFFDAALPEELSRLAGILLVMALFRRHVITHCEIVGALVAMGFALMENVSYAISDPGWRVMPTLGHAADGLIMGACLYQAIHSTHKTRWLFAAGALIIPVILHGLYDVAIMSWERIDALMPENAATAESAIPADAVWVLLSMVVVLAQTAVAISICFRVRRREQSRLSTSSSDSQS